MWRSSGVRSAGSIHAASRAVTRRLRRAGRRRCWSRATEASPSPWVREMRCAEARTGTPDRSPAARPACGRRAPWRAPGRRRCGQGASGLTWSGVTGDTPPQSLMPARISCARPSGCRLGGAWMFMAGPKIEARHGDGPQLILQRRLRRVGHARAGLGAEVLDDDLLDVAVALVDVADGQQRLDALGPRLADADQDAGGERHARAAGGLQGGEAHAPAPCRASRSAGRRARDSRSDAVSSMMPCETDTLRRRAQPGLVHHAGIEMRQQAGLAQHQRRRRLQVGQRRLGAERRRAPRAPRRSAAPAGRPA